MSKQNTLESEQLTDAMYYILLSLIKERHGYAIMKFVEDLSQGHITIGPGTLYTLLKKLDQANWIHQTAHDQKRQKIYQITPQGRTELQKEYERRCFMVEEGRKILLEEDDEK